MKKIITLYYDCVSPYTFWAFACLRRYTAAGGPWADKVDLHLRPFLLGGVLRA